MRLVEFIESRRDQPFAWGTNDCVMFAAGAIEAITGEKVIEATWTTALQAGRYLNGNSLESAVDARFERTTEPQRGDIGLVEAGDKKFLGVVYPPHVITPGPARIVMNRMQAATIFWKVGR